MSPMSVLAQGYSIRPPIWTPNLSNRQLGMLSSCVSGGGKLLTNGNKYVLVSHLSRPQTFRIRSFSQEDAENNEVAMSNDNLDGQNVTADELLGNVKNIQISTDTESSFLAKIAIALGIAATITLISVGIKGPPTIGSSNGFQFLPESATSSVMAAAPVGFSVKAFGYSIVLPAYAPGWIYFWLLMAAGCGLFISEEALNIWVGISLARMVSLDGTWQSFAESFSRNAPYIISTALWVYWGVCISDLIPFYLGKLFRKSRASDDILSKLGIGKEKALSITSEVQRYGNLIGFVERFSLGVRNPTAFVAGALGISSECFFAGVCFGGLITLPIQLLIGFFLRERPVFALATVATAVGIWTVFPYLVAASTALFLYLRRRYSP
ncbi:PREDICTED: LOC109725180 isoform [Prunus dulcis]|uniref:PREDICTED: LOC109725180 isoform n=1 Tax=Prunus dulcis TaxID=3755 RepID=A0A5E4EMK9_PRUDU|nr:uncharacterized protein LOC117638767 isoform X1 [Prunus dulcis]KAI5315514.1 hypothetical protein L3X38_044690 [Prunus dulcis]VVA15831.1 PREDICTED: LOC109725180 isoform [Prunus dulcis]